MQGFDAMTRMRELLDKIKEADDAYFVEDKPIMSDRDYDALVEELQSLEKATGIVFSHSPSRKVSGSVKEGFTKVEHSKPMLSAKKTKNLDDIASFKGNKNLVTSWKMDGLSIILRYSGGRLVKAITRGDGMVGEDVTKSMRYCPNVPQKVSTIESFEVRGECVISWSDAKLISKDDSAHPRNIASGAVRTLFPDKGRISHLRFFAFEYIGQKDFSSKIVSLSYLEEAGFEVVPHTLYSTESIDDIINKFDPNEFPYPVDGLIFEYEDLVYGRSLGATEHHENRMLALKWSDEKVDTVFLGAELSTGKSGKVSIIVNYDPVTVCGSKIRRALITLSDFENMKFGVGDKISVYRANMIFPQIAENYTKSGTYTLPLVCPSCGHPLSIRNTHDGRKELVCKNGLCIAKNSKKIAHFADKDAMNIKGLSAKRIESLIENGWVSNYRDLYHLEDYKDEIINTHGFGVASYTDMVTAIENSRNTTLSRFLVSMAIPGFSLSSANAISKYFGSFDVFSEAMDNNFNLEEIDGITHKMSLAVKNWYNDEDSRKLWKPLMEELSIRESIHNRDGSENTVFMNSEIVITGTIPNMTRNEFTKILDMLGATVKDSVSSSVDYLIVGFAPGGKKLADAMRLGVQVISYGDFLTKLGTPIK